LGSPIFHSFPTTTDINNTANIITFCQLLGCKPVSQHQQVNTPFPFWGSRFQNFLSSSPSSKLSYARARLQAEENHGAETATGIGGSVYGAWPGFEGNEVVEKEVMDFEAELTGLKGENPKLPEYWDLPVEIGDSSDGNKCQIAVTSRTPAKETRDYKAVTYKDSSDLTCTLEKTTMTLPYF